MIVTNALNQNVSGTDYDKSCQLISRYLLGYLFSDEVESELIKIGLSPDEMVSYEKFVLDLYTRQDDIVDVSSMDDFKPGKSLKFFFNTFEKLKSVEPELDVWRKKSRPDNTTLEYLRPQFAGSKKFIFNGHWLEELGFVQIKNYLFGRTIQPYMISEKQMLNNCVVCFDLSNIKTFDELKNVANINPALLGISGTGDFSVYTLTKAFRKWYSMDNLVPEDEPAFAVILYGTKKSDDAHEIGNVILDLKTLNEEFFELGNQKNNK